MMQLYYLPGACSLADHIVLEWTGADYDVTEVSPRILRSADFLAMNPGANVPLLRDGDLLLTENVAVLHYLAERFPHAALMGDTPRARAETMRWLAFMNSDVHSGFKVVFALRAGDDPDPQAAQRVRTAQRKVRAYLERLDRQLAGREWITGTRSIADPYLLVMFRWAVSADVDLDGLRNLTAFARRMYLDAGVKAALLVEEGLAL
ncbi:glutathione S-transferase family protein [Roseateles chitosanitabidus]|uniref:glutathione S-transferase family protein n=1 Tax=Roseateles chitosanitabidus TaxID=65048 RepID=UPI002356869F|nr:glutathione S-transferase N-terminal domain-containing protein [Roseateles chitosanitabidus]